MKKLEGYQKGVNLGGWLSQWVIDGNHKNHLETFITEDDIKNIKSIGCDHLRLPVDYENVINPDKTENTFGVNKIEECVNWCKKYNLNVVLDLHKAPGYIFDDEEGSADFFYNDELMQEFLDIWDLLSKRFAKYTYMMMFEMLNEVTKLEYKDSWNTLAGKCVKVIRKNCPDVKILYGGVWNSSVSAVKYMLPAFDKNVIYNIHCYEPLVFTHQGAYWVNGMDLNYRIKYSSNGNDYIADSKALGPMAYSEFMQNYGEILKTSGSQFFIESFKEAVAFAEKHDTTLYCGEYGVIDLADAESTLNWLKDINTAFKAHGIGRALWNYKEKDFGLIGDHYKDFFDEMIKYL